MYLQSVETVLRIRNVCITSHTKVHKITHNTEFGKMRYIVKYELKDHQFFSRIPDGVQPVGLTNNTTEACTGLINTLIIKNVQKCTYVHVYIYICSVFLVHTILSNIM